MNSADVKVDSPEGIARLVDWARSHKAVLSQAHAAIAERHGVSVDGVIISRPIALIGEGEVA